MLATVDFDDELCPAACEVGDVGADRQLPGEPGPVARQ
jgi:hypothetical protein